MCFGEVDLEGGMKQEVGFFRMGTFKIELTLEVSPNCLP